MNKIILMGRLGRDPESRYTPSGKQVTNFSIAVDTGWGDKKQTSWFRCNVWEKKAEAVAEYFRKGSRILVEGECVIREYEANGEKKWSTEVNVQNFYFVDAKGDRPESENNEPVPRRAPPAVPGGGTMADMDDDIPF
jgi:single-strand DNA-binding protein